MADETNFRSSRSSDPYNRSGTATNDPCARGPASTPAGQSGNDPLAELARLIGQNDPFTDLARGGFRGAPQPSRPGGMSDVGGGEWHAGPAGPAAAPYDHSYAAPAPEQYGDQPFESEQPYPGAHAGGEGFQPAYDPAIYGAAPSNSTGYPPGTYYEGPAHMPQGEEEYDDAGEPPPRRGLKAVMLLVGLVVLGAGGAFAYRGMFGSGGTSSPPPVIKADTNPNKVVPAQSGEASNKLIYDRVGDASQGEKVVSREEQPVDIKDASRSAPRSVFPGLPPTPQDASTPPPPAGTVTTLTGLPSVGPASAEPKKVRTVTIRPDQPATALDSTPARSPAAPSSRNAAAAATAAPTSGAPPTIGPRYVAPKASGVEQQQQPAAPAGNAPLSISPQGVGDTSARPGASPATRTATATSAPPQRVASAPTGTEATGAYTVQLSSQRSEAEAQASFRSLQSKFPNLLNDRQPIIRRADLGEKGIYFRAMVGPFATVDQATELCGSLKSAGGQCVVQRN
jgi:hypothetical protein